MAKTRFPYASVNVFKDDTYTTQTGYGLPTSNPYAEPVSQAPFAIDCVSQYTSTDIQQHSLVVGQYLAVNVGASQVSGFDDRAFFVNGSVLIEDKSASFNGQPMLEVHGRTTFQPHTNPPTADTLPLVRVNGADHVDAAGQPLLALDVHGNAAIVSKDPPNAGPNPPTLLVAGTLRVTRHIYLGDDINNPTQVTPGQKGDKGDKGDAGDKGDKGDKGDPGQPGTFPKDDSPQTADDVFQMNTGTTYNFDAPRAFLVNVENKPTDNHLLPVVAARGGFVGFVAYGQLPNAYAESYGDYFAQLDKTNNYSKHVIIGTPPYARGINGTRYDMYGLVVQNRADFVSLHLSPRTTCHVQKKKYADAILAWGNEKHSLLRIRFVGRSQECHGSTGGSSSPYSCKGKKYPPKPKKGGCKSGKSGKHKCKGARDVLTISPCGRIKVGGIVSALGYQEMSDGRLKEAVEPIAGALDRVGALRGVMYQWKKRSFPFSEQRGVRQMGLVAQDVERIFPEIVSTDEKGFKSIDYGRLTPALIEALKEQQAIIEDQRARLERLEAAFERLGMLEATSATTPEAPAPAPRRVKPAKTPRADRPARGSRQ